MSPQSKAVVAIAIGGLLVWRPWKGLYESDPETPALQSSAGQVTPKPSPGVEQPRPDPPSDPPPSTPPPATISAMSPEDLQKVRDAIDNIEFAFRDFSTAMRGNPVGNNAEITAALLGDNEKQLKLEIPGGSTLNDKGELCDPWGTPWFFHQLSATQTEVRSAGPDRKMYSEDDFVR
jgi:hypothetical protein